MNQSRGSDNWHQDVGTWFKSLPTWVVEGQHEDFANHWGQSNQTLTFGEAQKLVFGHTAVAVVVNVALLAAINHLHSLLFLIHLTLKGAYRCLEFISQEASSTLTTVRQQFIWAGWVRSAWDRCTARPEEANQPTGINNANYAPGVYVHREDGGVEPAIDAIGQAINDLPMPAMAPPPPNPPPMTSQPRTHARSLSQLCALDAQLATISPALGQTGTLTRSALQLPLTTASFPAELLRTPSATSKTSSSSSSQNQTQVQFNLD